MEFHKENRGQDWRKLIGLILLLILVGSIIYTIFMIVWAPSTTTEAEHARLKSDYLLMLTQCVLGIIVMSAPSIIEKRFSLRLPNYMYILYFVFLFCAIYLGEVRSFYFVFAHWDTVLHSMSAAMLGSFGFIIIETFDKSENYNVDMNSAFVAFFAFCFAVTVGAVWEIYEFFADGIFGFNMQKFALEGGEELIGRAALADTMQDIITDALSALIICVIGYFTHKRGKKKEQEQVLVETK